MLKKLFLIILLFAGSTFIQANKYNLRSPREFSVSPSPTSQDIRKSTRKIKLTQKAQAKIDEDKDSIKQILFRLLGLSEQIQKPNDIESFELIIDLLIADLNKANNYLHKLNKKIKNNSSDPEFDIEAAQKDFNSTFRSIDLLIKKIIDAEKIRIERQDTFDNKLAQINELIKSDMEKDEKVKILKQLLHEAFDAMCVCPEKYAIQLLKKFVELEKVGYWDQHIKLKQLQLQVFLKSYNSSGSHEILLKRMNFEGGVFFTLEFYLLILNGDDQKKGIWLKIRA